ncbi:hypothetical protein BKA81DRAFT_380084 [Phyllosticta paracitricarpa]
MRRGTIPRVKTNAFQKHEMTTNNNRRCAAATHHSTRPCPSFNSISAVSSVSTCAPAFPTQAWDAGGGGGGRSVSLALGPQSAHSLHFTNTLHNSHNFVNLRRGTAVASGLHHQQGPTLARMEPAPVNSGKPLAPSVRWPARNPLNGPWTQRRRRQIVRHGG